MIAKTIKRFIIIFLVVLSLNHIFAWWNCNWRYRAPITIQENSGKTLYEYQIKLTIDTASLISTGKMRSDCGDIRFTYIDPSTGKEVEIPYWIDEFISGCNRADTIIWIKVPKIPANGKVTVYMYYGNPSASSASNKEAVFTYEEPRVIGYIVSNNLASGGLRVISLADDNVVCAGDFCVTLNNQETYTFPSSILSQNTPIKAKKPIQADGATDCADMISPISWAGTKFYYRVYRGTNIWDICSPFGTANVKIYDAGTLVWSGSISGCTSVNADITNGNAVQIESDIPILVQHRSSEKEDSRVLYPATAGVLVGIPSNIFEIGAGPEGANVKWERSDGTDGFVSIGPNGQYSLSGLGSWGSAPAFKVTSDRPIGIDQLADSDGVESTTFLPLEELDTVYGSANPAGYIAIAAPYPSTTCILYDSSGNVVTTLSGGTDSINKMCYGCGSTTTVISGGWKLVCNKPVFVYYENDVADSDETNMMSYKQMRQYVYPEPTYSIGTEEDSALIGVEITTPTDGATVDKDTLYVEATALGGECAVPEAATINIATPVSKSYTMSCQGMKCWITLDLNEVLENVGIASDSLAVEYYVNVNNTYYSKNSNTQTFYIRTSHNVSVLEPTEGSIVLGSGFSIKVKSDSILKIRNCYPHLPTGAVAEKVVVDPNKKTCEIWVDLSNYCGVDYIEFNITIENVAGVNSTSESRTHYIYDPQIVVEFVSPTPDDGESLSLRYLPIKVKVNTYPIGGVPVPTTKKFAFEINGVNYTVYGDDSGYALLELFHPNLTSILGTEDTGSISFKVYGLGRCGYTGSTELRTVIVPAKIFKVNYMTPPTPNNGDILNVLFMEIQGNIQENILAEPSCELWISKDNGFSWIRLKDMPDCYNYIVNDEFDLYNLYYDAVNGYYVLLYKIILKDKRWGEYNESIERTVYISPSAETIPAVNSGMDVETIQKTINDAITNGKPAVLFETGYYKVNLIIDPQGKSIRLLGANSVLTAASKGSPVITVKSGNVTIEKLTIKDSLFNIRINNGYTVLKDVKVYGGLYGTEINNAQVEIYNSIFNSKIAGIKATGIYNSKIQNVVATAKVWGAYLQNANNVIIDPSTFSAKVFGIHLAGNCNNNTIDNVTVSAKVFGILIDSGQNNTIRNSKINAQVFGIKMPGNNTVDNVIIDGVKVFGIYSPYENTIRNVIIKQAKVFGLYIKGSAYNVTIYNSKLGAYLSGSGSIPYLTLGDTTVNITYSGGLMLMEKDPTSHPTEGVIYTGKSVYKLGSGSVNITFIYDNPRFTQYYVYNILGSLATLVASGKYVEASGIGIYALYGS